MTTHRVNRIGISAFRHSVHTDPQYAERTWKALRDAICKIMERKTSELSYERLYRYGYNMVLQKHGDTLYNGLTECLTEHLNTMASTIASTDAEVFLSHLQNQWSWFKLSLSHIRDVFMYMDRSYVVSRRKKTVNELGVSLFRDCVIRNEIIHERMVETVLARIDDERNGETIDTHTIRAVTRMLVELGDDTDLNTVYVNFFENSFLERTKDFYAREASLFIEESTCAEYLRKAERRMREEETRVETYLDSQTMSKVREMTEHELIYNYMQRLVDMPNSGLIWMLRNDKCYDLQLMYTLLRNLPDGETALKNNFKNEVLERGTALVNDTEIAKDHVVFLSSILSLREKYDRILRISFSLPRNPTTEPFVSVAEDRAMPLANSDTVSPNLAISPSASGIAAAVAPLGNVRGVPYSVSSKPLDGSAEAPGSAASHTAAGVPVGSASSISSSHAPSRVTGPLTPDRRFVTALNEAFERFLNNFSRSPEYISLYIDKLLRQDMKGMSDDEVELKLDAIMALFRYLHDKDVFEAYYKQHLAKRLLNNRTSSLDAERSFIGKLKNECGYLYTSKMETMFNDMRTSAETVSAFQMQVSDPATELCGVDLNVSVLTTISWPVDTAPACSVPRPIVLCCESFEKFYNSKHNGRKLSWQTQMANAELRGSFGNYTRQVDLSVSAYGVCILMLYNEHDQLTVQVILALTGIPQNELTRNLQSLAMGKHRVLLKEPKGREIEPSHVFSFNEDFSSRNRRIKIQMVTAQKENETEKSETRNRIDEDRKPLIEAAIIRVMKDRKTMDHQQLIAEVTSQLACRFEPNPYDIKLRIESLVEREFLERDPENRSSFTYIA